MSVRYSISPAGSRPRGIFSAADLGCCAAISARWRAMLAESGMEVKRQCAVGRRRSGTSEAWLRLGYESGSPLVWRPSRLSGLHADAGFKEGSLRNKIACQGSRISSIFSGVRAIWASWERLAIRVGSSWILRGDPIAVAFEAILKREFSAGERMLIGIAAAAAGKRMWIARESRPQARRADWERDDRGVFQVNLLEQRASGEPVIRALGDTQQQVVATDFERRHVELSRLFFAPVPDGVQHREAGRRRRSERPMRQAFSSSRGKPLRAGFDLARHCCSSQSRRSSL